MSHPDSHYTQAFAALVGRAFHNTPNLLSLILPTVFYPLGKYLRGSPFRLQRLDLACDWNVDLSIWLAEQASICAFTYIGLSRRPISLDPLALPNLSTLSAYSGMLTHLAPGRPVQELFI